MKDAPTLVTHEPAATRSAMRLLAEGERIGRYTIRALLGRGGMGAVYEADDPELERRVAIKVLHEDRDDGERDVLRSEAQALATLVHPNVVMVYDVGVDRDGDVFLVMQLVEGETIDAWIARTRPSRAEIVAKFRLAGRGLAAAHAAGLVHCDFKPANVLVDARGEVRVGDFGLARRSTAITKRGHALPVVMTTLAGTPAYMAPEQFDGVVTPATDQFAFCVALWESLVGERPFEDSSVASLDRASRGSRRRLPPGTRLARAVRRVLERGLAELPGDRYPSMQALLDELAPPRPTSRPLIAAGAITVLGASAYWIATRPADPPAPTWDAADLRGRTLLTQLGETGCAYAPMIDPGGQVIFDRTSGEAVDLYTVPLAGGPARQLTSGPNWEWRAQRGRKPGELTYLIEPRREGELSQIMRLDLATGTSTSVLQASVWDAIFVGDRLFYSPNEHKGIWVATAAEKALFSLPTPGFTYYGLTASYDNTLLGLNRLETNGGAQGAPCTLDVATGKQLRCFEGLSTATRPAFGRDAHHLYVATLSGVVHVDLVTGYLTKITSDYVEGGLAVAPDGSALVLSMCRAHSNIIDAVTGAVIVDDPDGNQITLASTGAMAWVRTIDTVQVLMVRSPTGKITRLTSPEQGSVAFPRFSPDGRYLVFGMTKPKAGLHVVEVDKSGSLRQVTDDDRDYNPHWIDGEHLAFVQVDEGGAEQLFAVGLDGGDRHRIVPATRALYGARGGELLVGARDKTLWLDPITKRERPGPPRPADEDTVGTTSPSGTWVVYQVGFEGHELYRTRTDGSTPVELVRRFDSSYFTNRPAITDDGQIILSAGRMYGDLVKIPAKPNTTF